MNTQGERYMLQSPLQGVGGKAPLQGGWGVGSVETADLGGCPAAVDRRTGTLYIDPEAMARLTPFQRRFVILHEEGHYALGTDDEIKADAYAFDRLAGTQPRSLRQSVESLEQILDDDNPTLRPRYRALLRRALEWDAAHGNPRAAAELQGLDYATGRQSASDATYTLAQADALLDQTYYAGEAQLQQGRANIVLYLVAGLVAALYLL